MGRVQTYTYIYMCTYTHTHTHTREYYSATERNEIWPFVTRWMDLEGIVVSKISQTNVIRHHSYVKSKYIDRQINRQIKKTGIDPFIQRTR